MTRLPVARLVNGWKVARPASEASCIAALGGPSILFPILQSATTTTQICDFLYLLRTSVDESLNNLKYMQTKGYKIISFILSLKPKTLIATSDVMDALFELCIHRGITVTDENVETETLLLTNTPALYYLLLNQQVWNARSFTYPQRILCYLSRLVHDPRHGSLNSRRLGSLGVLRWLLLMSVYGVERGSIVSAEIRYVRALSLSSFSYPFVTSPWFLLPCYFPRGAIPPSIIDTPFLTHYLFLYVSLVVVYFLLYLSFCSTL